MYENGYEPKVGDKVRRNCFDCNMKEGEEGVVSWVGEYDKIKIVGKPDDAGFLASFFTLLSRPVRYADGNDAAVGDLVECVVPSPNENLFTGRVGQRYEVAAFKGALSGECQSIDLKPGRPAVDCGLTSSRFKLIARACPYKVVDWVHSVERKVEFQVSDVRANHEWGWSLDGEKQGCFSWNVASLKPGRLPAASLPVDATGNKPISVADEVRVILDRPRHSQGEAVASIVDLIMAKTERLEQKIVDQAKELSAQNSTCRNYKTEIVDLKGLVAEQSDQLSKLRGEVRSKDDALQNAGARNRMLEGEIARERSRNVQLHDELRAHIDCKALYENLRNKLREVAE